MKHYKKIQIHMVSTDDSSDNMIVKFKHHMEYSTTYMTQAYLKNIEGKSQHLYITDDSEIKDNEHFMSAFYGYPLQNTKKWREKQKEMGLDSSVTNLKHHKIIASTDPKLKITQQGDRDGDFKDIEFKLLFLQPSQDFIKLFCELNGKGEFEVEYEEDYSNVKDDEAIPFASIRFKLKVNPDNTLNIKLAEKKIYSKEEVISLIARALNGEIITNTQAKWIKENL